MTRGDFTIEFTAAPTVSIPRNLVTDWTGIFATGKVKSCNQGFVTLFISAEAVAIIRGIFAEPAPATLDPGNTSVVAVGY